MIDGDVRGGHAAREGQVALAHDAGLELRLERGGDGGAEGEEEDTARASVEAVDGIDAAADLVAQEGHGDHAIASQTAVNEEARGLVDGGEVFVEEEDVELWGTHEWLGSVDEVEDRLARKAGARARLVLTLDAQLGPRHGQKAPGRDLLLARLAQAKLVRALFELDESPVDAPHRLGGVLVPRRGDGLEHLVERLLVLSGAIHGASARFDLGAILGEERSAVFLEELGKAREFLRCHGGCLQG